MSAATSSASSPKRRAKPAAPTLARIADVAGVDKSTVSRALRGHRVLPEETTRRIRRIARSLGYRHSPLVGAVMRRARGGGEHRGLGQVAYLTFDATPTAWRDQITFRQFFTGAETRGEQLGLQVVPFWMKAPGLNPRRTTAILEARGITGLLIGPTTGWTQTPELNWQRFCAVKVGAPFPDLPLPDQPPALGEVPTPANDLPALRDLVIARSHEIGAADREAARLGTLARRAEQKRIGWRAAISAARLTSGQVRISVALTQAGGSPEANTALHGELRHPADENKDRDLALKEIQPGLYQTELKDVSPGSWDVLVSNTDKATPFEAVRRLWVP